MRIDLVIPTLGIGGSERQIVGLAKGLAAEGLAVRVITLRDGGLLEEQLKDSGIGVVSLRGNEPRTHVGALLSARALWKLWRQGKPDAVQAWLPEAQIVALPIARLLDIRQRWMVLRSMSAPVNLTRASRRALAIAARCSTLIVGNARAVVNDPGWPIGKTRRLVIPNAVTIPDDEADAGAHPARGICVANLTPIKGHADLLSALAMVSDPPRLVLLGTGPEAKSIAAQMDHLGLEEYVELVEGVSEPQPSLLDSQFFVLASPSEGLPNAVIEAMAAGLPIVAYKVGGVPEIVEDGVTGLLVTPGDTRRLARAIEQVAGDASWRREAGSKARRVAKTFTWESLVQRNIDALSMPEGKPRPT